MNADPTRNRHRQPVPSGAAAAIAARPGAPMTAAPALRPLGAGDDATVHELLVATQQQQLDVQHALARLVYLQECAERPADLRTITLDATNPRLSDDVATASPSFGVYNPTDFPVYVGLGTIARPGSGALAILPRSLLVLPIPASSIDFGADPADVAAGSITFYLLRFATPQPASMGSLA